MTTTELTRRIAEDTGRPIKAVREILRSHHKIMMDTLAAGENVYISEFGMYKLYKKRARSWWSDKLKAMYVLPERFAVSFTATPTFARRIIDEVK